jgi:hypothetical protein
VNTVQAENPFSTDHLYLAAYLVCRGHSVASTKPTERGRISFLFSGTNEVRSAAADFMGGGQVEARQFAFTILRLKKSFQQETLKTVKKVQHASERRTI